MAFDIKTINQPNQFAKFEEVGLVIPDPGGATESEITSSTVYTPLPIKHQFLVEIEVTETSGANGSLDVEVQGSADETNWVSLDASLGLAVDSTGANTGRAFADLADQNVPYYRFRIFTDGTDILDSATVTLRFWAQPVGLERFYPRR